MIHPDAVEGGVSVLGRIGRAAGTFAGTNTDDVLLLALHLGRLPLAPGLRAG